MEKELTNTNSQELINQSKKLSGSFSGTSIPFIPIISINNNTTEKEVEIEGKMEKVEVPAVEGFNITTKDEEGNYNKKYYKKELEAVILRVRYSIISKNKVTPRYYSFEYDQGDYIQVFDENRTVIAEGNYAQIRKAFETGEMNSLGKPITSFDLNVILYIDLDETIYRYKVGNASRSDFFDYSGKFGNDTFTAYKTKFNISFNDKGKIKFWQTTLEKSKAVDLGKEIILQQELEVYFSAKETVKGNKSTENNTEQKTEDNTEQKTVFEEPVIQVEEDAPKDDIKIDQIPF